MAQVMSVFSGREESALYVFLGLAPTCHWPTYVNLMQTQSLFSLSPDKPKITAGNLANEICDPTHAYFIPPTFDSKRENLLRFPLIRCGEHVQKLLRAQAFEYDSSGFRPHKV